MFHVPEQFRINDSRFESEGNNGVFILPGSAVKGRPTLRVVASDGLGWEHVSVSLPVHRVPTWDEMCYAKSVFWDEEDCVIQYHPPKSEYINDHPFVLHLWRPVGRDLERPPSILVGDGIPIRIR